MLTSSAQDKGREIEALALAYLSKHKHQLLARNFRCRLGEIDLVTLEGQVLVFTEVRYRLHQDYGGAAISVDQRKQAKIIKTAQYFLLQHPEHQHRDCRFDIIAFDARRQPAWIRHAFET